MWGLGKIWEAFAAWPQLRTAIEFKDQWYKGVRHLAYPIDMDR